MHTYTERQKTANTDHFVNMISRRLSGRQDTQGCEYRINIIKLGNKLVVDMAPLFYVYPSRHRRSDLDKKTILDYAMHKLFSDDINYKWNNSVQIVVEDDCFVPGCYAYVKYENANRRKWTKTIDFNKANEIVRRDKLV